MSVSPPPEHFAEPRSGKAPFTIAQAVAWGEMDSLGHVNNAVYLRWFENVRFDYFEQIGLNAFHAQQGIGPILARATVDFLAPVQYPDELRISTRCQKLGRTSFVLFNRAWSTALGMEVARGEAIIVMMDYRAEGGPQKTPIPAVLRAAIETLEGDSLEGKS